MNNVSFSNLDDGLKGLTSLLNDEKLSVQERNSILEKVLTRYFKMLLDEKSTDVIDTQGFYFDKVKKIINNYDLMQFLGDNNISIHCRLLLSRLPGKGLSIYYTSNELEIEQALEKLNSIKINHDLSEDRYIPFHQHCKKYYTEMSFKAKYPNLINNVKHVAFKHEKRSFLEKLFNKKDNSKKYEEEKKEIHSLLSESSSDRSL